MSVTGKPKVLRNSLRQTLLSPGTISSGQPLTRADCDQARLAWDDNGNVCDWQAEGPKERLASSPTITGAISSGQPLTRADCDKAGLPWDDNGNVCDSLKQRT